MPQSDYYKNLDIHALLTMTKTAYILTIGFLSPQWRKL